MGNYFLEIEVLTVYFLIYSSNIKKKKNFKWIWAIFEFFCHVDRKKIYHTMCQFISTN